MNNILVPTDFSDCADHASEAAIQIAKKWSAKIHYYHCLDIPADWKGWPDQKKKQHPDIQKMIDLAVARLRIWADRSQHHGIESRIIYSGGKVLNNIEEYVAQEEIDFIVMGSHGRSGKSEYFIGSNTQKIVRKVHCPIMVMKEALTQFDLKQVVFASGFDQRDLDSFRYFLDFVRQFNPTIHLLSINTAGYFAQPYVILREAMEQFQDLCGPMKCKTHFYTDFSVDSGIRRFSNEIGVDLIGISNHNRTPIKRFIFGSSVEALVNHSTVPVLSIDHPD